MNEFWAHFSSSFSESNLSNLIPFNFRNASFVRLSSSNRFSSLEPGKNRRNKFLQFMKCSTDLRHRHENLTEILTHFFGLLTHTLNFLHKFKNMAGAETWHKLWQNVKIMAFAVCIGTVHTCSLSTSLSFYYLYGKYRQIWGHSI